MCDDDEAKFYTLLLDTDQAIRPGCQPRTEGAMNIIFDDLEQYSFDIVRKALVMHRRDPERGQWPPNTAHIEHQINIRRPIVWLSADEAWSRAPKIENQPAVMTLEVAQALAAAQPLIATGDTVAARMAFKGCYDRLVERAKVERRGPEYFVSPGGSYEDQLAVRDEGVRMGMLPPPKAEPVLQLETTVRTPGAKPDLKALLLTLKPKELIPMRASDYE